MPSKKRKYNARFPAGRIKKIMRLDNDIGKVALPVPVMISRALEIFVSNLLEKACNITMQKNARTLTLTHLKQSIYSDSRLDFLKELVKNIPDVSEECNDINFTEQSVKKKESITNSDSGEEELSSRPHFINVQSQMEGDVALQTIHSQLLNGCVCRLSIDAYYRLVSCPPHVASISDTIDNFSTARLLLSTRLQGRCPTIKRACSKLISDPSWLDYLLDNGLSSTNEYVRHAGVCVVSEAVFCCAINGKSRFRCLIDKLMVTILCKEHGTAAAAINVLARVLNGTDDEHPAKRNHLAATHNYCTAEDKTETVESRPATSKNRGIKTLLLNHLHHYWTDVVYTVVHKARLSANSGQTSIALSELVQLWKSIVSALFDEKHYYSRYYSELPVLRYLLYRPDTDPYVWLNIVRLFGTSLKSIQCAGYETAVAMAKTIMIGLTVGQLLCFMQKILNAFGSDGWTTKVIQETVLLAMRSLRVFAVHGDADHGSTVTNVTLMVVHSLESYVKTALVEVNDVRVCQWLVRLMYDRDDAIVECLMCGLDIVDAVPGTMQELDPFESFCEFLMCISFEVDVILDYLISDEIDFLLYMLKILKMAASDFTCFRRNCRYKTKNTMELLIKLRLKILRLHNVFPYNITPIAKLIQQCDQLYIKHKLF